MNTLHPKKKALGENTLFYYYAAKSHLTSFIKKIKGISKFIAFKHAFEFSKNNNNKLKRWLTISSVASCLFANTGCAYLTTYTRAIDLENQSYAMDIKQRVVISKKRPLLYGENKSGQFDPVVVCAEPSPDALAVIGASGGLSLKSAKLDAEGNLGGAFSENGAFVGLRTHSIQLLRDAMYRLCEGYASGAMSPDTFRSMQRRFQSTMMGLIAIEQLTGPVHASQALLTSSAAAQAGVPAADAAVAQAQDRADATDKRLLESRAKVTQKSAELETSRAALQANLDAQKKAVDDAAKASLKIEEQNLRAKWDIAKRENADAQIALELSERASLDAHQYLNGAHGRASAGAAGSGRLGQVAEAISESNKGLVAGVVEIVKEVNLSYLRDSCYGFTAELLDKPDRIKELNESGMVFKSTENAISPVLMLKSMLATCQAIFRYEAARMSQLSGSVENTMPNERSILGTLPSGNSEIFESPRKTAKTNSILQTLKDINATADAIQKDLK